MRLLRIFSVCSALALAACGGQNDGPNISNPDGSTRLGATSLFDPAAGVIPFPFDGLFADASGNLTGTLNIPNPKGAPFVNDANRQDGFSTVASAFTDFTGKIDFATANTGLIVIDGSTGATLTPGTDYLLQTSTALDDTFGTPINSFRTRILIEPLKPLKESTTYIVAVTSALKSTDGLAVVPNAAFKVVSSSTPVTGSPSAQDMDTTSPDTYAYLHGLTPTQKFTLEALRARIFSPVVGALTAPSPGPAIPKAALVLAWPFTTQSITKTLTAVNNAATGQMLILQPSGLDSTAVGAPAGADIYIGKLMGLPYYLANATDSTPDNAPLNSYWRNNGAVATGKFAPNKAVDCSYFVSGVPGVSAGKVTSTTACFPMPAVQSNETIPVIATVPNSSTCQTAQPAAGWPVVIFQHGITGNRTQMLGIGPTLAGSACMVTIAIDLPLHGLPPPKDMANLTPIDKVYLATGGIERTFNLDANGNGPTSPDYTGTPVSSGTHFINLASVITSRDNIREAVADLITLTRSIPTAAFVDATFTPIPGVKIDPSKIYFIGHSLGGIVGGTLLGVNTDLKAATLAMPGGGIAKLLDASASFSPVISQGLAAKGVVKGTDTYETFLRFAQTLVDSGDPINYAVTARANHPIHMIEVIGGSTQMDGSKSLPDQVVPNNALAGTLASIPGYLSGTDPLYRMMGLAVIDNLDVPASPQALNLGPNLGYVVRFKAGDHGSILSPAASEDATKEMQRETVNFLASGGTCLPIGRSCSP